MHHKFLVFIFLLPMIFKPYLNGQAVIINEVLPINTSYTDEDGDASDWIELYNSGSESVTLNEWSLTDRENEYKWSFGDVAIPANDYILIWASGKDKSITYPRTLIDRGDIWKYITPTQPLNNTWINHDYNDINWSSGASGFGYADGDDATGISNGTRSVFIRKEFKIEDISKIEELYLDIDYDDGFVAYLNGREVARANMAEERPSYNDVSITDHEAQIYSGGAPDRFVINKKWLKNDSNVLAIQGHNISSVSSDFTLIPFLTAIYNEQSEEGTPPPPILDFAEHSLHTNFKLSAGETVFLYDENGQEIDQLLIQQAPADVSLGISPSNGSLLWYDNPTPLEKNQENGFVGYITDEVIFSQVGGVIDQDIQVKLSTTGSGIILYTTDATEPTSSSNVYTNPINVDNNTVIRARLFDSGLLPSKVYTQSYIREQSHNMPVISLVTEPDNFFSDEKGIYVLGDGFFPTFPYEGSNIWEDWERPVHVSLYESDGSKLQFDGGTKIFGGWSRAQDQRSLSIFARGAYGLSEIDFPLFPDKTYQKYQAFILRNSGNDFLSSNIRDAALTSLMDGSGIETQAYRPVATYINGEYWGFFHMREKMNEHYLASRYDVNIEDLEILGPFGEIIQGSDNDYRAMLAFLQSNSLTEEDNYNEIAEQVDIDNFIIYNIAQIYYNNTDWPGNNNKQWRTKSRKWRWLLYDIDFGFGTWDANSFQYNTLDFALESNGPFWPNPPESTLLLRKLVENEQFRHKFINQFADEMNSRFLPDHVSDHIEQVADKVISEVQRHYTRWNASATTHFDKVDEMIRFGKLRPASMKNHLKQRFGLPAHHQITLQVMDTDQGYIQINSLKIDDQIWKGDYFQSVPITITAYPKEGYKFSHWVGPGTSAMQSLTLDLTNPTALTAIFVPTNEQPTVVINEINYNSPSDDDAGDWVELHNPSSSPIYLDDWVISDKEVNEGYRLPEGTLLQGGDFLILTRNEQKFKTIHGNNINTIGDLHFGLSREGESVKLYSSDGTMVDSVSYHNGAPWPTLSDGNGYTLELLSPDLDNSLAEHWANLNLLGSPGSPNENLTNVSPIVKKLGIQRYPNPFRDHVQIDIELANNSEVIIRLLDYNGKLVSNIYQGKLNTGNHQISDNLGHLANGSYMLKIEINGKPHMYKWIRS